MKRRRKGSSAEEGKLRSKREDERSAAEGGRRRAERAGVGNTLGELLLPPSGRFFHE